VDFRFSEEKRPRKGIRSASRRRIESTQAERALAWRFRRLFTRLDFIDDFALLAKLISDHLGSIPEADAIRKILKDAIPVYEARNLLAHGHWYSFDPATSTIEARAWDGGAKPRNFTEAEIWFLRDQFKEFLAELHKLRFEIEKLRAARKERRRQFRKRFTQRSSVSVACWR
jgi:hypothetical protein